MDKLLTLVVIGLVGVIAGAAGVVVMQPAVQLPSLGSGGPVINGPYIQYGGVTTYAARTDNLNQASTTACSLQSPAATSTLVLGSSGIRYEVSSTTAVTAKFYKAANPDTATTFLFGAALSANAKGTIVATTSADAFVFGPNQWFNVVQTGGTGTYSPSGACQAQFVTI